MAQELEGSGLHIFCVQIKLSSTCHVSFLAAPDTDHKNKFSLTDLIYFSFLSDSLTNTHTQDQRASTHIYPAMFHGRVADQHKSHLSHLTAANTGALFILKTPKNVDFLPLAPDLQDTRRARMTWRPPVSECRDETTWLRPNVLTGHKVSPTQHDRKRNTPSGTTANTSTDVSQPETCGEQRHLHLTSNMSDGAQRIRA